jgi:thioredoxin 1
MLTSLKSLLAITVTVLFVTSTAAQPFSRILEEQEMVPDSSQQIADRIVQSKLPVVVDFWAAWCAPCRMINPIIARLEKAYKGRVMFMKVNIDYNRQFASYLGVQGIPAVFFIKDKAVRQVLVGVRPETDYRKAIKEVLAVPSAAKVKQDTVETKNTAKKTDTAEAKKSTKPQKQGKTGAVLTE